MPDLTLPQLGETVAEGTITRWFRQVGDRVAVDDVLYEVSTDKVDSEVPSPFAGVLTEIVAGEGAVVQVGEVIARFDGADTTPSVPDAPAPRAEPATAPASAESPTPAATPAPPSSPTPRSGRLLSPLVRRLVETHGVDAGKVVGTGLGGRVTRRDVEQYVRDHPSTTEPFTGIRRATARHMVASKATSAHVLTAMEVDYEAVEVVRAAHREAWRAAEGFSLTYLPFIVRALALTLREFPRLNASVGDDELVVHAHCNLAVAVDLDFEGLVAPVIRRVDDLTLSEIGRSVSEAAGKARARQLVPDDLAGGTFTVTNAGQYGTLLQFPIINQPQVAILSTDGVARKPVAVTDGDGAETVAVHSVGVLALAWDHRAFDGAYAAAGLRHLRTVIETHDWESEL